MFFHIDESGNTGNNLLDANQPVLSYGVLSCQTNADVLCCRLHKQILGLIDDEQIHANVLGIGGLVKIAPLLIQIQQKMKFDFDFYFIHKPTFAVVTFFDAVFDAGLNEAVKWEWYWTPLRYLLIENLTQLFDDRLLRESWRLCTVKRIEQHEQDILTLLEEVRERAKQSSIDKRRKEVIIDTLDYGIVNPLELDFAFPDQKMLSPNVIAFQFVASAIARRVRRKKRKRASSILVDRQSQFNKAQAETHKRQALLAEGIRKLPQYEKNRYIRHPLFATFGSEQVVQRGLTGNDLTISSSAESIGLQIVDVYLWLTNKILNGSELPVELQELCSMFLGRTEIDGISLEGMLERFHQFESLLPELGELTEEQYRLYQEQVEAHREKVRKLKSGPDS
ncbi:hypothetical protein BA953_21205 [Vibrio coralliilyticus]|uniref:DUF3800 domain-containing protein n=1 Tax=Vibrio coralliilyticus TaxID=190893 RepID=UPI0008103B97|nr:DUF3800 domain-containing protein [Vibrio coralliilyticus]ANW26669.1 hypothetical protein BA953_21205 [Vibrio coralliilyticus]